MGTINAWCRNNKYIRVVPILFWWVKMQPPLLNIPSESRCKVEQFLNKCNKFNFSPCSLIGITNHINTSLQNFPTNKQIIIVSERKEMNIYLLNKRRKIHTQGHASTCFFFFLTNWFQLSIPILHCIANIHNVSTRWILNGCDFFLIKKDK